MPKTYSLHCYKACFLVLGLLLLSSTVAFANPANTHDKFHTMDTNKDNYLSWEEFSASLPQMKRGAFDAINTDGDEFISHDEWQAFSGQHQGNANEGGQSMPQGMGGGMMGGNTTMPPEGMKRPLPLLPTD